MIAVPVLAIFGPTIALSAFLLFSVEPLVGRLALPVFGGAPAVWATVSFFFQAVLVLGYLYGHLSVTRLGPGRGPPAPPRSLVVDDLASAGRRRWSSRAGSGRYLRKRVLVASPDQALDRDGTVWLPVRTRSKAGDKSMDQANIPGSMRLDRWLAVGQSSHADARAAGADAIEQAVRGGDPKLLIVFCSDSYDLPALLGGIGDRAGDVPLIGCSTAGEIATSGPGDAGVVVLAFGGQGFSVATAASMDTSQRLREAGAEVAGCLTEVADKPHVVLLLLTDGLAGDQQEIVRGAYSVAGAAIPLVGGCAGDDLKMTQTFQFHNGHVLRDAVVGAAISSDAPFGIGVRHGWRPVGEPMVVNKSANNRVHLLDDQPALDAYLARLSAPAEAWNDPVAFTRFALTHPLGLSRRSGEEQVRFVAEANFEDRSLGCIAEVPQGGLAWIMEGDSDSVLAATDAACSDALEALGGRPPLGLIAFDCIARKGVLGSEGIQNEVDRVAEHALGAPVAGFYTYGEIARTRGITGFHNQTLVVLAVA